MKSGHKADSDQIVVTHNVVLYFMSSQRVEKSKKPKDTLTIILCAFYPPLDLGGYLLLGSYCDVTSLWFTTANWG